MFASQMALQGFLSPFLSFTAPVAIHMFPGLLQALGRENAHGGGTQEDWSTKNLWLCQGLNPNCQCERKELYPLRYAPQVACEG